MAKSSIKRVAGSLDTNVLLRYVLHDIPQQSKMIDTMLAQGAVYAVEDSALFEMMYVLEKVYLLDRYAVAENVYAIIRSNSFRSQAAFFEMMLPLYIKEHALSVIDCALLVYARFHTITPLKTFDKDIVRLSRGDASTP